MESDMGLDILIAVCCYITTGCHHRHNAWTLHLYVLLQIAARMTPTTS